MPTYLVRTQVITTNRYEGIEANTAQEAIDAVMADLESDDRVEEDSNTEAVAAWPLEEEKSKKVSKKPRRKRRTKAEIAAAKLAAGQQQSAD